MTPYRKSIVAAFAAVGVVLAGVWPEVDGLQEAIASVGAIAVWWVPNSPHVDEGAA